MKRTTIAHSEFDEYSNSSTRAYVVGQELMWLVKCLCGWSRAYVVWFENDDIGVYVLSLPREYVKFDDDLNIGYAVMPFVMIYFQKFSPHHISM